jgi:Threonine dehydrogenase and related Zn-dependent dehydrogenases
MKALVYHGRGQSAWESAPDPVIGAPTDAIVRITSSTIWGNDSSSRKCPRAIAGLVAALVGRVSPSRFFHGIKPVAKFH